MDEKKLCDICGRLHTITGSTDTKICRLCGKTLPRDCFGKHNKTVDGLQPYCRVCQSDYAKTHHGKKNNTLPVQAIPDNPIIFSKVEPIVVDSIYQPDLVENGLSLRGSVHIPGALRKISEGVTKGAEYIALGKLMIFGYRATLANGENPNKKWDIEAENPLEPGIVHKIDVTTSEGEYKTKLGQLSTWQEEGRCHIALVNLADLKIMFNPPLSIRYIVS